MSLSWDRQRIAELLLRAGRIALEHYERPRRTLKDDGSIVTQADTAIERFLTQELTGDGALLLGEETEMTQAPDFAQRILEHPLYIVDPIDGTAPYAHHVPVWGISVGFARGGVLEEGAVYLPCMGELFITDGPSVYLLHWPVHAGSAKGAREEVLVARTEPFVPSGLLAISQSQARAGQVSLPNPVHALCCAVVPLTYLLLRRYEAYVGDLKLWDLAGALPMLHKLGYDARLRDGTALSADLRDDWVIREPGPKCWKIRGTVMFAPPGQAMGLWGKVRE